MYSFKSVLYLDTTAICNQIKYYLTTNRGNFARCSVAFTGMFFLQIYDDLLLKEHLPKTQEKLERAYLESHRERSLRLCGWSSTQVSLFLLAREAGIVNVQGCGMHWYLSWLATSSFIIIWEFSIFYQILLSPQVKRWAIITYKHGIYELPHELQNDLRFRMLGN